MFCFEIRIFAIKIKPELYKMKTAITHEELKLLIYLRLNSREKLTKLSRITQIPVSTIHEKLRQFSEGIIRKHTIILNSEVLGYPIKTHSVIKADSSSKQSLGEFLKKHDSVNNLYKVNNGFDYVFDAYFKGLNDAEGFFDILEEKHKVKKIETHYILDELKREGFLNREEVI
ncbi:Transcriptional regulator, AsnC family [archaeon GW2011_AR15]|nr:Transcriptional regulator, AsnC family [archaeon GW2011_AR15]